jgi:N-acetylmuramate 1-kinase
MISWADPHRQSAFDGWLQRTAAQHHLLPQTLAPASADASFRRYFRVQAEDGSHRIVMDAPPAQEDCAPFVQVASLLTAGGLNAPQVLDWDRDQGFMLLTDLGQRTYLQALSAPAEGGPLLAASASDDRLYRDALAALVRLQAIPAQGQVPAYDEALMRRELDLFPVWYIERHCGVTLTERQREQLDKAFALVLQACTTQPAVLVHRDYHARNLMVGAPGAPGILDFQDAVWGPITYDLASLLRDAYIEWDEAVQLDWAVRYWEAARKTGLPVPADFGAFWRDFEWMGLQRHLKVLGIFARLYHRDGKDGYLKDLPRVWRYAHHVAMRYAGLTPLARLLEDLAGVQARSRYTF